MVERSLSMREAAGSMPAFSTFSIKLDALDPFVGPSSSLIGLRRNISAGCSTIDDGV